MRVLAALIVFASLRADAHPVRDFDDYYKPPPTCPRTGSWAKLARCQFKEVNELRVLQDLPAAKLVSYVPKGYAAGTKRLELYVLSKGSWTKTGFYAETNPQSELLGFESVNAETYRLDMGYAAATWVTLDEVNTRPALLRRRFTYYCSVTNGCRSVLSSCDVLVHGKAVAMFKGTVKWTRGNDFEIRGDASATNRYCTKPPNLIEGES